MTVRHERARTSGIPGRETVSGDIILTTPCAHYRRALEIEPSHGRSYLAIATVLDELGSHDEALRFLRHGSTAADSPEPVQEALRSRERPADS